MRALASWIVVLALAASPAMARARGAEDKDPAGTAPANSSSVPPAANSKDDPAKTAPSSLDLESELQQLRDLIETQSSQLQAQSEQLKSQQQKMQSLQEQISAANTANNAVAASASSPAAIEPTATLAANSAFNGGVNQAAAPKPPEAPTSIAYKGITLTPVGFMAAETVWRQKAMASDVNTPFNSVPYAGASAAHVSEFNASGRQSRFGMLFQGKLDKVQIGGYYEADFLSAGTTSNNNQSNSYTLRQRQFWGQAAFTNGWTVTGGQQWSLLTETASGMNNRTENLPMVIDAQYVAGFSWARQFGFRVTKSFNNKIWLGFAVEEAQATLTTHGNPTAQAAAPPLTCTTPGVNGCSAGGTITINTNPTFNNFLLGSFGAGGGLYNPVGNYAFNLAPDLVLKAVYEPKAGQHYEVFGLLSQFRDRVFPCVPITGTTPPGTCSSITSGAFARNDSRTGGGAGGNARWNLLSKKVDLGVHFFGGSGIGRYGSVGLPDATTRPNGTLALLRNYQALGTLQLHPMPKLDIYFNAGGEWTARAQYTKSGSTPNVGYGALALSNAGCFTETLPVTGPATNTNTGVPDGIGGSTGFIPGPLANCTGDTRGLVEGTVGFWYRFYNGPKGRVQAGAQYSNFIRNAFSGVGTATGLGSSGQPHADQNMFFTSFRYYLP